MIFRNKDIEPEKSGCLVCDDLFDINEKPISKESLENFPVPQKGKVISGTLGTFSIKDMEDCKDVYMLQKYKRFI